MTRTVAPVVCMNVSVAAMDRRESRANPQTPWPDVQPEAKVTPIPTMNPPTSSIGMDTGTWTSGIRPVIACTASGPLIIPRSTAARAENNSSS